MNKFCDILKELRKERKVTQPELAKKIGVSNGMISMWESGKCEPTAGNIIKLALYFDTSADYLLGLTEDR